MEIKSPQSMSPAVPNKERIGQRHSFYLDINYMQPVIKPSTVKHAKAFGSELNQGRNNVQNIAYHN